jgi:hypothetical protein
MLKELYVRSLDESEYQRLIGIALDTGIDNFEGHALHVPFRDVQDLGTLISYDLAV